MRWGRATHIYDPNLIREMFKLIYNQYDGIGEVMFIRYARMRNTLSTRGKGFSLFVE